MLVVGLTGPMGAGKTHVLQLLASRGAENLRADDASRELLRDGSCLLPLVMSLLGDGVFRPDGSLDRRATAALIFADEPARRELEGLLHPRMVAWLRTHLAQIANRIGPPRVAVLEAAVLTHMGARSLCDRVVRVWAPRDVCLKRICARDGITLPEAEARMSIHDALGLFDETADRVIDTSGSPADTHHSVASLWDWLSSQSAL